jgi:hypothetical protein
MNSMKRSGIYSGLTTCKAAPDSDISRTVHSMAVSANSMEPVFNTRRRGTLRRRGSMGTAIPSNRKYSLNDIPGVGPPPRMSVSTHGDDPSRATAGAVGFARPASRL